MPELTQIQKPKQLVVEGADAVFFFKALLKQLNLADIQIQNFGGITELGSFLKALSIAPNFATTVISLGIVRDNETNPTGAFQSVCSALQKVKLSVPKEPLVPTSGLPRINVLLLPNTSTPGMLETLCLQTVSDDPVMRCVEQYFTCVEQEVGRLPKNPYKAKVQSFLSSREKAGLRLGEAAFKGDWNWNSPALDHVKEFLWTL